MWIVVKISFDPLNFMIVADNMSNGNSEGQFRTSISRSYYSVFLQTREKIERKIGPFHLARPGDIHQAIIYKLKDLRLGYLADKLDLLRKWRRKADYFLQTSVDQQLAKKALVLAKDIHRRLIQEFS